MSVPSFIVYRFMLIFVDIDIYTYIYVKKKFTIDFLDAL